MKASRVALTLMTVASAFSSLACAPVCAVLEHLTAVPFCLSYCAAERLEIYFGRRPGSLAINDESFLPSWTAKCTTVSTEADAI